MGNGGFPPPVTTSGVSLECKEIWFTGGFYHFFTGVCFPAEIGEVFSGGFRVDFTTDFGDCSMFFTEVLFEMMLERDYLPLFTSICRVSQLILEDYSPLFTRVFIDHWNLVKPPVCSLVEKRKFVGGWAPFDHAEIHIVCNPSTASQLTTWLKWAFTIHPLLSGQNLGKT